MTRLNLALYRLDAAIARAWGHVRRDILRRATRHDQLEFERQCRKHYREQMGLNRPISERLAEAKRLSELAGIKEDDQ